MAFAVHTQSTANNQAPTSSHSHPAKRSLPATPLRHHAIDGNGPWPNYKFPSKWEINDDFMCVHFIPKTVDKATWSSQCSFWSEAISLYAEQLLYECPLKLNRLTFSASDIKRVYQRKNRLVPMCIIDIMKWMNNKKKSVILAPYLDQNYSSATNEHTEMEINDGNNSFLSISGVSSMMTSMLGYFMSNTNTNSDDEAYESECDEDDNCIKPHTKILYTPIVDELCERMSSLQFYRNVFNDDASSDLIQLLEIGIIDIKNNQDPHEMDVFIVNGLVFDRFCIQILKLTQFDVRILKKYLMHKSHVKLFYLDNDMEHVTFSGEILEDNVKNEMICFHLHSMDMLDKECLSKMQLLSINLTMKHLKLQKTENELNLNNLNKELLDKLKKATTSQQKKQLMQKNIVLLKRKKALKHRISSLDGSIYNLETTLHSMEDVKINKMVFNEMKNADKLLKYILHNGPSVEEVHGIKEDIKESMEINEEMGQVLSNPMDTDDVGIDDDELLKEYEDLEVMHNVNGLLPEAPNHDIVIKDLRNNNADDADKQVLIQ